MTVTVEIQDNADEGWNDRLLLTRLGNIYQTKEYAEYARKRVGWQPLFIKFLNGKGEVITQLLLFKYSKYERKLSSLGFSKLLSGAVKAVSPDYKWIYGPVILQEEYRDEVYRKFGELLHELRGRINGSTHPLDAGNDALEIAGCKKEIWGTFMIDLTLDKQRLWQILDKKAARKNIERARERNVTVKSMNDKDIPTYFNLLKETKEMLNLQAYTYEDIYDNWHMLKDCGFAGFLAYQNERPLAGLLISTFNNYINEWGVARSKYDLENHLYSQDLIKWTIIEWGHDNGYNYYDLSGINPNPKDKKELGIFRYKQKWGGKFVYYTVYKRA